MLHHLVTSWWNKLILVPLHTIYNWLLHLEDDITVKGNSCKTRHFLCSVSSRFNKNSKKKGQAWAPWRKNHTKKIWWIQFLTKTIIAINRNTKILIILNISFETVMPIINNIYGVWLKLGTPWYWSVYLKLRQKN